MREVGDAGGHAEAGAVLEVIPLPHGTLGVAQEDAVCAPLVIVSQHRALTTEVDVRR